MALVGSICKTAPEADDQSTSDKKVSFEQSEARSTSEAKKANEGAQAQVRRVESVLKKLFN